MPARRRLAWTALLLLVGAAAGLWLYGFGAGGGFYHRLVRAPLAAADAAPYYRESLLHVGLAHGLGLAGSRDGFRLFVLAFFWTALAALTHTALRRLRLVDALLIWGVALTHPAAMIVHAWTCHPDAVLLLWAILLPFSARPWHVAILAALAAWTNLPMAIVVAAGALLLWRGFGEPDVRRRGLALLLGLACGAATCRLTLWLAGVHLARDRFAAAAAQDPATLWTRWADVGLSGLYSLHFAHLLWLPALVVVLRAHRRGAAVALLTCQSLALVAATLAEDTTRIFACLALPSLLYSLFHGLHALEQTQDRPRLRPLVVLGILLSLLGPHQFAWKGRMHDLAGAHAHLRELWR